MNRIHFHLIGAFAAIAVTVAVFQGSFAAEQKAKADKKAPTGPTYVLTRPEDRSLLSRPQTSGDWKELHRQLDQRARAIIQIVDRSKVDESLFVDNSGIRMYADSAESRDLFNALPQQSDSGFTLSWLVRDLLGRRYAETGIEPEMIRSTTRSQRPAVTRAWCGSRAANLNAKDSTSRRRARS